VKRNRAGGGEGKESMQNSHSTEAKKSKTFRGKGELQKGRREPDPGHRPLETWVTLRAVVWALERGGSGGWVWVSVGR